MRSNNPKVLDQLIQRKEINPDDLEESGLCARGRISEEEAGDVGARLLTSGHWVAYHRMAHYKALARRIKPVGDESDAKETPERDWLGRMKHWRLVKWVLGGDRNLRGADMDGCLEPGSVAVSRVGGHGEGEGVEVVTVPNVLGGRYLHALARQIRWQRLDYVSLIRALGSNDGLERLEANGKKVPLDSVAPLALVLLLYLKALEDSRAGREAATVLAAVAAQGVELNLPATVRVEVFYRALLTHRVRLVELPGDELAVSLNARFTKAYLRGALAMLKGEALLSAVRARGRGVRLVPSLPTGYSYADRRQYFREHPDHKQHVLRVADLLCAALRRGPPGVARACLLHLGQVRHIIPSSMFSAELLGLLRTPIVSLRHAQPGGMEEAVGVGALRLLETYCNIAEDRKLIDSSPVVVHRAVQECFDAVGRGDLEPLTSTPNAVSLLFALAYRAAFLSREAPLLVGERSDADVLNQVILPLLRHSLLAGGEMPENSGIAPMSAVDDAIRLSGYALGALGPGVGFDLVFSCLAAIQFSGRADGSRKWLHLVDTIAVVASLMLRRDATAQGFCRLDGMLEAGRLALPAQTALAISAGIAQGCVVFVRDFGPSAEERSAITVRARSWTVSLPAQTGDNREIAFTAVSLAELLLECGQNRAPHEETGVKASPLLHDAEVLGLLEDTVHFAFRSWTAGGLLLQPPRNLRQFIHSLQDYEQAADLLAPHAALLRVLQVAPATETVMAGLLRQALHLLEPVHNAWASDGEIELSVTAKLALSKLALGTVELVAGMVLRLPPVDAGSLTGPSALNDGHVSRQSIALDALMSAHRSLECVEFAFPEPSQPGEFQPTDEMVVATRLWRRIASTPGGCDAYMRRLVDMHAAATLSPAKYHYALRFSLVGAGHVLGALEDSQLVRTVFPVMLAVILRKGVGGSDRAAARMIQAAVRAVAGIYTNKMGAESTDGGLPLAPSRASAEILSTVPELLDAVVAEYPGTVSAKTLHVFIVAVYRMLPRRHEILNRLLETLLSAVERTRTSSNRAMLLVSLVAIASEADEDDLDALLETLSCAVQSLDMRSRNSIARVIFPMIRDNHDRSKKDQLMRWYLNFLDTIPPRQKTVAPSSKLTSVL